MMGYYGSHTGLGYDADQESVDTPRGEGTHISLRRMLGFVFVLFVWFFNRILIFFLTAIINN